MISAFLVLVVATCAVATPIPTTTIPPPKTTSSAKVDASIEELPEEVEDKPASEIGNLYIGVYGYPYGDFYGGLPYGYTRTFPDPYAFAYSVAEDPTSKGYTQQEYVSDAYTYLPPPAQRPDIQPATVLVQPQATNYVPQVQVPVSGPARHIIVPHNPVGPICIGNNCGGGALGGYSAGATQYSGSPSYYPGYARTPSYGARSYGGTNYYPGYGYGAGF